MKLLSQKFSQIALTLNLLKYNKKAVLLLIAVDAILAVVSIIVDWPWLMGVPRHLILFAPICALYPLLLTIWMSLWYFGKKIPPWFTTFLFIGLVSYGIMAWIYYPAYMSWAGVNLHDLGSILWVTLYGGQSLVIASELKKLPVYQYIPIFGYFFFKDYSDRYLGTFLDILLENYPENLKLFLTVTIVSLHFFAASLSVYLPMRAQIKVSKEMAKEVNEF